MDATPPTPAAANQPVAIERPRPGAYPALVLLLLINLMNYIDRYILAAVEPMLSKDVFKGADAANAKGNFGILASAFMVSYMALSPVFGALADRWKRWIVIGIGVTLWSFASAGSGMMHSFMFLLAMRICVGVGEAAYGPTAPTLIADLYPVSRRGGVMAWFYAAIPVGSALGYVIGGLVGNSSWTWHWAFFLTLPPGLLLAAWCFFMPDVPRGGADGTKPVPATKADYLKLLRTPSFVYNTLGMTAMTFAVGGISFWAPTYFSEYRLPRPATEDELATLRATVSSTFGGIVVVAGLLATISGGYLADRLRKRFPGSYLLVSGASMLVGFPFFLGVLYAPFPWAWVFTAMAVFCLFFNTGPSNTVVANVTHPSLRATAFAVTIFCIHILGDVISPPIIGTITDHTKDAEHPAGNMTLAFSVVGIAIILSGILWMLGARHLERDTAAATRSATGT